MDIIEKIQSTFNDVDQERVVTIARTCFEMVTPVRLHLALCRKGQNKLKIIQSKRKEAKSNIKEMAIKAQYAVDLYYQHLDIEFKKQANDQPFTVPMPTDDPSIFKVDLIRFPDAGDEYHEEDHLECALANAQKVCAESIVWTIFYSELEDMELEVKEELSLARQNELPQNRNNGNPVIEELVGEENNLYLRDCQRIFKDGKGRNIFEYLHANLVSEKNQLADYTFIFRRMQRDEYIYEDIKEKVFRDFLSRNLEIEIDNKLRPEGYNITDFKEKIYSNAIRSMQINAV